jgi:hypothetical protein
MLELAGPPIYEDQTMVNGLLSPAAGTAVRSTISAIKAFVVYVYVTGYG